MHKCQIVEAMKNYPDCQSEVTRQYDMDGRYYCDIHYRAIVWVYDRKDVLVAGNDSEIEWGPYPGSTPDNEAGA